MAGALLMERGKGSQWVVEDAIPLEEEAVPQSMRMNRSSSRSEREVVVMKLGPEERACKVACQCRNSRKIVAAVKIEIKSCKAS